MKLKCLATFAASAFAIVAAAPTMAAVGDQWVLGIHHLGESGAFTQYSDVGYSGPLSSGSLDVYGRSGPHGSARIYWELSGNAITSGNAVPTTTELYTVEFYGVRDAGRNDWQPVESQFNGAGGETYPIEPNIPWAGHSDTNHQYMAADGRDDGEWHFLGPGPQSPESNVFNADANGSYMWLTSGSWLFAKWDFPWDINRSWSALRLTQVTENGQFVTPVPEPGSIALALFGTVAMGLVVWRKRSS